MGNDLAAFATALFLIVCALALVMVGRGLVAAYFWGWEYFWPACTGREEYRPKSKAMDDPTRIGWRKPDQIRGHAAAQCRTMDITLSQEEWEHVLGAIKSSANIQADSDVSAYLMRLRYRIKEQMFPAYIPSSDIDPVGSYIPTRGK